MLTSEQLIQLPIKHQDFYNDFTKRYKGTFLWIQRRGDKEPTLHKICNFIQESTYETIDLNNQVHSFDLKDQSLSYDIFLPDTGYYQLQDNSCYIYKYPQRQWKRSFCESIYQLSYTSNMILRQDNWRSILKEMIKNTYTSLNNITQLKTQQSKVLSPQFVCMQIGSDSTRLFYRTIYIGDINFKEKLITLIHPIIEQEVLDLLKRTKSLDWNVKS